MSWTLNRDSTSMEAPVCSKENGVLIRPQLKPELPDTSGSQASGRLEEAPAWQELTFKETNPICCCGIWREAVQHKAQTKSYEIRKDPYVTPVRGESTSAYPLEELGNAGKSTDLVTAMDVETRI